MAWLVGYPREKINWHPSIDPEKCVKCGMCFKACPVGAISGNREKGYVIDQEKCIRCGQCFEVCKPAAVLRQ